MIKKLLFLLLFLFIAVRVECADYIADARCKTGYLLQETSGNAIDTSSASNDGVLGAGAAAPAWVTNGCAVFSNKSLSFDGGDTLTPENDASTYIDLTKGTISFWYKASASEVGGVIPYGFWVDGSYLSIIWTTSHTIRFQHRYGYNDEHNVDIEVADTSSDTDWHHISYRWNVGGNIDGVSARTQSVSYDGSYTNGTATLDDGAISGSGTIGESFYGQLDEIAFFNDVLTTTELSDIQANGLTPSAGATIALTGTVTTATEADVRAGGKTIILTLTGDTWLTSAGGLFDAQRQNIINGLTSAGSETHGWNNEVRDKIAVTDVVRTSDTIVTITLDAEAGYDITANETITATIPYTATTLTLSPIVAAPTFTTSYLVTTQSSFQFFNSGAALPTPAVAAYYDTIALINSTTGTDTGSNFDVVLPGGYTNNDYLVMIAGVEDDNPLITCNSTWTTGDYVNGTAGNDNQIGIFYKKTNGTETNPTFTTGSSDNAVWWVGILRGVNTTTPEDETMQGNSARYNGDVAPNATTITTATNGAYVLAGWAINQDTDVTMPGGSWATRIEDLDDAGTINLDVVSQTFANAGATGNVSVTSVAASQATCAGQWAFRPTWHAAVAATGRTELGNANANVTCSVDTDYGIDIRLQNTNATSSATYQDQYSYNGGAWTNITNTSSVIKATLTADFANGDDVPEYIKGSGTYVTDNNAALESAGNLTLTSALSAGYSFEEHSNYQIVSGDVNNGDTIDLRKVRTTDATLDAYTYTPRITVSEGGAAALRRRVIVVE